MIDKAYQRYGGRYGDYDVCKAAQSSVSEEADFNKKGDSEEETKNYVQKFRVRSILQDFPPPMEYHQLAPIKKVAYLFYVAVYKKLYSDVGDFHRVFNREYHKYTCDDDSDSVALWKVGGECVAIFYGFGEAFKEVL
ncbi:Protein transport protein Sec16B [Parelaphostrongylus tenuis]|uniref:Protein transport protein Sec16B n=1 Tax=Parelaphostrongylus tenuis TaxID=148309 RepID=A0AAD5MC06_PARTN|nr:Protein transport protein Sec16B [Parelaphostrongylus tenuis]